MMNSDGKIWFKILLFYVYDLAASLLGISAATLADLITTKSKTVKGKLNLFKYLTFFLLNAFIINHCVG